MASFNINLHDGFQDIFSFRGHRLHIRGFNPVEIRDDANKQSEYNMRPQYISWDAKQIILWESSVINPKPRIVHQMKYSSQQSYICSIVLIPKMKVFLAAALDMTFKIYDRKLTLLESIHHEERAILQLEYDNTREVILTSGASGISVWRLYRNLSLDAAHIMEKLYSFDGCIDWVTRMIFEPQFNRIYAIRDRSAQVFSLGRKTVVTELENVHDAPLNVVCWYERNQFYITGCSRGEIKCWTSNYSKGGRSAAAAPKQTLDTNQAYGYSGNAPRGGSAGKGSSKIFALLHVFRSHTKAVTAIHLHPVSGLAISSSLDGFIKVLNLEALNELFSINTGLGVLDLQVVPLGPTQHAILFSQSDAVVRMWKISSVCGFFSTSNSRIQHMRAFENIEADAEQQHFALLDKAAATVDHSQRGETGATAAGPTTPPNSIMNKPVSSSRASSRKTRFKNPDESVGATSVLITKPGAVDDDDEEEDEEEPPEASGREQLDRRLREKILVSNSTQDLRVYNHRGTVLGRMEPEHVVEGIKAYTVSVYQKILYCLIEGDRVRAYSLKQFSLPLLKELSIKGSPADEDMGNCCTLINCVPNNAMRGSMATNGPQGKHDLNNVLRPEYLESVLLVGLKTGSIVFLDTLHDLDVLMNFQAHNGIITHIKYRSRLRELMVMGLEHANVYSSVRAWRLPEMELLYEVADLTRVSAFEISPTLRLFAVGSVTGSLRLFNSGHDAYSCRETIRPGANHDDHVNDISFCDQLRVYATCADDRTLRVWDYEKRLVRVLTFNMPTCGSIFNGDVGDVVVVQGHYLLTVYKGTWDEGNALHNLKTVMEQWGLEVSENAVKRSYNPQREDTTLPGVSSLTRNGAGRRMSKSSRSGGADDDSSVGSTVASTTGGARKARRGGPHKSSQTHRGESPFGEPLDGGASQLTMDTEDTPQDWAAKERPLPENDEFQYEYVRVAPSSPTQKQGHLETSTLLGGSATFGSSLSPHPFKSELPAPHRAQYEPFYRESEAPALVVSQDKPFDVLHPRFLIRKKPPARAVQLQDLEDQLWGQLPALRRPSEGEVSANDIRHGRSVDLSVEDRKPFTQLALNHHQKRTPGAPESSVEHTFGVTRRVAQVGLSPRARLTLLSCAMPKDIQDDGAQSLNMSASARVHEQQQRLVIASVNMRVSEQYRKHRETRKIQEDQRFQLVLQRQMQRLGGLQPHPEESPSNPPSRASRVSEAASVDEEELEAVLQREREEERLFLEKLQLQQHVEQQGSEPLESVPEPPGETGGSSPALRKRNEAFTAKSHSELQKSLAAMRRHKKKETAEVDQQKRLELMAQLLEKEKKTNRGQSRDEVECAAQGVRGAEEVVELSQSAESKSILSLAAAAAAVMATRSIGPMRRKVVEKEKPVEKVDEAQVAAKTREREQLMGVLPMELLNAASSGGNINMHAARRVKK